MLKLCIGFLVDTLFWVKWLARLNHADILVLVSESSAHFTPTTVGTGQIVTSEVVTQKWKRAHCNCKNTLLYANVEQTVHDVMIRSLLLNLAIYVSS